MEKLLELQRKLTPSRTWLIVIYFATILLFSILAIGLFGILVFAAFLGVTHKYNLIPATDKLEHFYWGLIYTVFGYLLYLIFGWQYWVIIPSILFGASKEIRDFLGYGNPEIKDFVATVVPSILTIILI